MGNAVIVRLRWKPRDADTDAGAERYQVLGIQNAKIREIRDCRSLADATRMAKRLAAASAA
jgi:hypothetical protein